MMQIKTLLSTFILMFVLSASFAQVTDPGPGSVTVFSEGGENFTLYLNGAKINATPSSRVVAENIAEVPVAFRIVFEKTAPELTKRGLRQGRNCLYAIEKTKKGEFALRMNGCSDEPVAPVVSAPGTPATETMSAPASTPAQLSAVYANGVITINDGRALAVKKVKVNGMTYPRVIMSALPGAKVALTYDGNSENFSAEAPFSYEVKDYTLNNAYFTLTVDEGGPAKTWHVKLQNANGYDLKIE